jgi:two-component system cell cycle sensor histidine kinase/response regulator CckA
VTADARSQWQSLRLARATPSVTPVAVDVNAAVMRSSQLLMRLLGNDILLEHSLATDAGTVLCDPGQLEQVLTNLVVNARDAMPDGGTVEIRTRRLSAPASPLESSEATVLIEVADTGVGMDDSTRERAFEPFFTTKQGTGTGLGLATVYGIVRQFGGEVLLASTPGHGTVVRVFLPGAYEGARAEGENVPAPEAAPGCGTVLVVDDDRTISELVGRTLSVNGYQALVAGGPAEALELADGIGDLDLLVTDIVMPGTSGIDLAAELLRRRSQLPVLFMSGYIGEYETLDLHPTQLTFFIEKPFVPSGLLAAVREALAHRATGITG